VKVLQGDWVTGRLIRRYKRFLADIELADGDRVVAHCPNTGAMTNCLEQGALVWLSHSVNPARKTQYTFELLRTTPGYYIGINTLRANDLVGEGLNRNVIPGLQGYSGYDREVRVNSGRLDFRLFSTRVDSKSREDCFVEVKSVTLLESSGTGMFPDAVTQRGLKHIEILRRLKQAGSRAVLLYCVQHTGIRRVHLAHNIDSAYADAVRSAIAEGVEVIAMKVVFRPPHGWLSRELPFDPDAGRL